MFKKFTIKEEIFDNGVNPECPEDVKVEIEDLSFGPDFLIEGLKSEVYYAPSNKDKRTLPIETIYIQEVSGLVQPNLFLLIYILILLEGYFLTCANYEQIIVVLFLEHTYN